MLLSSKNVIISRRFRCSAMSNQKKSSKKYREMVDEWKSWEYLIRDDVRRLNYRFLKAQEAMMRFGRSDVVTSFALDKMREIIQEECGG